MVDPEIDALKRHLLEPPIDDPFLQLEIRNAIAQQSADAVVLLEEHDRVPGARELLCAGQARRAGTDDRHLLPRLVRGGPGRDPTFLPRTINDRVLDRLDADGIGVDAQHAGFLAGRRADPPGELREIVRRVERLDRALPILPEHQVVEVGNDVVDRAPGHAERDAAVHAARALDARLLVGEPGDEFAVMLPARLDRFVRLVDSRELEEAGDLSHQAAALLCAAASSESARRYSFGNTFTNRVRDAAQSARICCALRLPVCLA